MSVIIGEYFPWMISEASRKDNPEYIKNLNQRRAELLSIDFANNAELRREWNALIICLDQSLREQHSSDFDDENKVQDDLQSVAEGNSSGSDTADQCNEIENNPDLATHLNKVCT